MKALRQLHLYLGTLCSPLILYFCLSGAWQVFGFHDLPKDAPASASQKVLHALSLPHTHSTPPSGNPRKDHSALFDVVAATVAAGMIITAALGLVLAWRFAKRPALVALCFAAGALVPVLFLFL